MVHAKVSINTKTKAECKFNISTCFYHILVVLAHSTHLLELRLATCAGQLKLTKSDKADSKFDFCSFFLFPEKCPR